MKRLLCLLLTATMLIGLTGCGDKTGAALEKKGESDTAQSAEGMEPGSDAVLYSATEVDDKSQGEIKSIKNIDADEVSAAADGNIATIGDVASWGGVYPVWCNFVNQTGSTIFAIYITGGNDTAWGSDLLGDYALNPGCYDTLNFYAYGGNSKYDILVQFTDGSTVQYDDCDFGGKSVYGFDVYLQQNGTDYVLSY